MPAKIVIAHHDYTAVQDDELSFEKNEVIEVTDDADSDWWFGKKEDGASGLFPSNFVTVREDNPNAGDESPKVIEQGSQGDIVEETKGHPIQETDAVKLSVDEKEEEANVDAEAPEEKKEDKVICMARVMEDYASQEAGEISLSRGGIIHVYEILDKAWSRGELNGKVGRYPSKYVEDIDMPGRPDLGRQSSSADSGEGSKSTIGSDEDGSFPKGGFKLAAFGVKQGGIGSLLAGGFPGLKKAGGGAPPKKTEDVTDEPAEHAAFVPPVPAFIASEDAPEKKHKVEEKPVEKAIVLHPYNAESEDELSLLSGEYVEILDRNADKGWWKGKNERGESGIFPANFVKELEEENVAPPAPIRSRRPVSTCNSSVSSAAEPLPTMAAHPRPASVQTPSTVRPVTLNQRPSSIQTSSMTHAATPPITKKNIMEEAQETQQAIQEEEEQYDADEEKPTSPEVEESPASTPIVAEHQLPPPPAVAAVAADAAGKSSQSPIVGEEDPISDTEEKESGVDDTPFTKKGDSTVESPTEGPTSKDEDEDQNPMTTVAVPSETSVEAAQENKASIVVEEASEEKVSEAATERTSRGVIERDADASLEKEEAASEASPKEGGEEEKSEFDDLTSGPKLTAPTRVRPGGRARRSPQATHHEPSQMETLQKELETQQEEKQQPVASEKPASPPAKPVKPIFAKFPTPFAVGAVEEISKFNLKPTQTRRLWDETPPAAADDRTSTIADSGEEPAPIRPSGVKNIASRFNFNGGGSGGNEVLETKLKNHTKNEIEKVRKEFEALLQQERENRIRLEITVAELMNKVQSLEN